MIKKTILLIMFSALSAVNSNAQENTTIPDSVLCQGIGTKIDLEVNFDYTKVVGKFPKTPILIPTIMQDGNILYLVSGCGNSMISLIDETGIEVYSRYVNEGDWMIDLPMMTGNYELIVTRGSWCFSGTIEL